MATIPSREKWDSSFPFFVLNGINVISYDQRGVGGSIGKLVSQRSEPESRRRRAIYDAMRNNPHVDSRRIGLWAFSNGGWTAPVVSLHRPIAFMILKSAPTESLGENIDYEVEQVMRRHNAEADLPEAIALWHSFEQALNGTVSWNETKTPL